MNKKYLNDGPFQVLPMALGVMMAAPLGGALLRSLEIKMTELPLLVAGSLCGAGVVIVSWLLIAVTDQASTRE